MNKRELVLSLLDSSAPTPTIPAAFFLHFAPEFREGQASVNKHIEYFRATGMDLVKIQYERTFPPIPSIQRPEDWATMPHYDRDFFAGQLAAVEGLVKALKDEAVIVVTLYSPYMCAGHTTSDALLTAHLREAPEKVKRGMAIITDSMLIFVRECIKLGVDGFYHSTQGGEAGRFDDASTFEQAIKPYDLALMDEANAHTPFNILHVCDYLREYDDFTPFLDYPGDIVSAPLKAGARTVTPGEIAEQFGRPYMGGLDRLGVLASGSPAEIQRAAEAVLRHAPEKFMLAADCTVPGDTPWDNLRIAIDTAHNFRRG